MAMVVTLVTLVVMLVLAVAVIQNSVATLRTSGNDSTSKVAAAVAEAGAEYTRELLRTQLRQGTTLDQMLSAAANGGTLVDATTLGAFGSTTASQNGTSNRPLVAPRTFSSGSFQVFLTNDVGEGGAQSASVRQTTDSNNRVMITSFGQRAGSLVTVQEQLGLSPVLMPGYNLPGVITLPGPTVNFQSFNSNARSVYGYADGQYATGPCYPTVAVTTNAAKQSVDAAVCARPNYFGCGQFDGTAFCPKNGTATNPSTENFLKPADNPYDQTSPNVPKVLPDGTTGNPLLTSVHHLNDLRAQIMAAADCTSTSQCSSPYGTTAAPMIVAIEGDFTMKGNESGAGILLVTGTLTVNGTPNYQGLILVIGKGDYLQNGAGNGTFSGAMLVANTHTPWDPQGRYVGTPTYNINGGGNSSYVYYDSSNITKYAVRSMPLDIVSFRFMH